MKKGFTLLELLIVIGIIAILAGAVVVALNPGRQFAQVRDTQRAVNLNSLWNVINQKIVTEKIPWNCDINGDGTNDPLPSEVDEEGRPIFKTIGNTQADYYDICSCLVPTYMADLPVDPKTGQKAADCTQPNSYDTQYQVWQNPLTQRIFLKAPGAELMTVETTASPETIFAVASQSSDGDFTGAANPDGPASLEGVAVNGQGESAGLQLAANPATTQIVAGSDFILALNENGEIPNAPQPIALNISSPFRIYGTLGDWAERALMPRVFAQTVGTGWRTIGAGIFHNLAVRQDGTLWAWGRENIMGELGTGNTLTYTSPTQAGADNDWKIVDGGNRYTVGMKNDNSLWSWGNNSYGQLGRLSSVDNIPHSVPGRVGSVNDAWKTVSAGANHVLAIKNDGTLWGWGDNWGWQLGSSLFTARSLPIQVGADNDWKAAFAGNSHSLALKNDGTLWAWGRNGSGQLGLGSPNQDLKYPTPQRVGSEFNWSEIWAGTSQNFAKKTDGTIWAWGWNGYGQLGLGDNTNRSAPTQLSSAMNGLTTISVGRNGYFTVGIKGDEVFAWGRNDPGLLGDDSTITRNTPTKVTALSAGFAPSGVFVSSPMDTGGPNDFLILSAAISRPATGTDLKFYLRAADTVETISAAPWRGPATITTITVGTATVAVDYYSADSVAAGTPINPVHNGKRFIQYKTVFYTLDSVKTPVIDNVNISYRSHSATTSAAELFEKITINGR